MTSDVPQVSLTFYGEAEQKVLKGRATQTDWKDRAIEALKQSSGPIHPRELARTTKATHCQVTRRAGDFYRTFRLVYSDSHDKEEVVGIDLHPDIRKHVEYEKASRKAS